MQAVILAAGMGKRLKELTQNRTKCMVEVNGITLIERLLRILDRKSLSQIVIVIGYCGESLQEFVQKLDVKTPIKWIQNPDYDKTNNIYSLSLAADDLMCEDTLLFESDIIFEESIVDELLANPEKNLAVVDALENWMDGTCLEVDDEDNIVNLIPGKFVDYAVKNQYYKTVNIYKFSKEFSTNTYVPLLEAYRKAKGENEYYESVIRLIVLLGTNELKALRICGKNWYEIDDAQDLDIAETIFTKDLSEKYAKIMARYGGFWRYPKLLDFCYLVNPYFPPQRFLDDLRANMDALLAAYPSGMAVNALLAGRNFGVSPKYIAVANGAAELIQVLMETVNLGRVGVIRPTFEEYAHRIPEDRIVELDVSKFDFNYDAEELICHFSANPIDTLVLINPDNPSGVCLNQEELQKLFFWSKQANVRLIVDESFVDFADEAESLLTDDILQNTPNLIVIKSISKSYGVPGLRLGIAASADEALIVHMKKALPIWNINSFAEFFMQNLTKYEKEYEASLAQLKKTREDFVSELGRISYLRVFSSQANYVMCEVIDAFTSLALCERLLDKQMLIKDLTPKIHDGKQYIRIAVRTEAENKRLIEVLRNL